MNRENSFFRGFAFALPFALIGWLFAVRLGGIAGMLIMGGRL